jgi:ATP-dependent Clp protease ATP-binding subunit ClpX
MDDVELQFDPAVLDLVVDRAVEYHLGARGLRSIMEGIMTDLMFDLPQMQKGGTYTLTPEVAKEKMKL